MGFPIGTVDGLLNCLGARNRDWCFILLMHRERPSKAVMQMMRPDLLTEFDEDSGDWFDFFLPGYSEHPIQPENEDEIKYLYPGSTLKCVQGNLIAHLDRLGDLDFSRRDFRTFYKALEKFSNGTWSYSGECEFLLFRRESVRSAVWCDECQPQKSSMTFCGYNLDDIVRNGGDVYQFIRQVCSICGNDTRRDWALVKKELDALFARLVCPEDGVVPTQDQTRMMQVGEQFIRDHFGNGNYVFISYSTKQTAFAERVRDALENANVKCWMAPRDIPYGTNYAYLIDTALRHCGLYLLLLSQSAMESFWVEKELVRALEFEFQNQGRIYVAWCTEPVDCIGGFGYTLGGLQVDRSLWSKFDLRGILASYYGHVLPNLESPDMACWIRAIQTKPELLKETAFCAACPWTRFSGDDWVAVLSVVPEQICRVPFHELSGEDAGKVLSRFPSYMSQCDWQRIANDFPWGKVAHHSEWINYFPRESRQAKPWLKLLQACPNYAEWCPWGELVGLDEDRFWYLLLISQPSLADWCDRFDGWQTIDEDDWRRLIWHCPQFQSRRHGTDPAGEN